jgi:hypothetical protein
MVCNEDTFDGDESFTGGGTKTRTGIQSSL